MSELRSDQSPIGAVLLAKDGRFFVYEPGVAVVASGDNIETAYRNFSDARRDYLSELERAGVSLGRPADPVRHDMRYELTAFFAKLCIVLVVTAAIATPVIMGAGRALEGISANISTAVASTGSLSLQDVTQKAADIAKDAQSLSDSKKEQLRQSIGIISREIGPLVDAWRNPPEPKSAPAK